MYPHTPCLVHIPVLQCLRAFSFALAADRPPRLREQLTHLHFSTHAAKTGVKLADDGHGHTILVDTHQTRLATETTHKPFTLYPITAFAVPELVRFKHELSYPNVSWRRCSYKTQPMTMLYFNGCK